MVAVLDDVHVADPSSLLLLQFLAGELDTMGLVVVATYRPAEGTGDSFAESSRSWFASGTRSGCASGALAPKAWRRS